MTAIDFPAQMHPLACQLNKRVLEIAHSSGRNIYIVGGYLRDVLLHTFHGRLFEAKDFDYAVANGSAIELARGVAQTIAGHFVLLDEENDTARVVMDDGTMFDFAGCVGGTIEKDLERRDFTINAMAWDPAVPGQVIDLFNGIADVKALIIRAVSERAFVEDPLRILRAYRFAATLGAAIDGGTRGWLKKHLAGLSSVAPERINVELFTTMSSPDSSKVVQQLGEIGILELIFPELKATRAVTPNSFHHLGLFEHSVETIPQLEAILPTLPEWINKNVSEHISGNITRLAATKVACLLHDIGKPETWVITGEGKHTFIGHDRLGAEMTDVIGERMRWSKPLSRFITKLVKLHLRPGQLFHNGAPTQKAITRFYRNVGSDVPELMLLAFADLGSTRGAGLMGDNRKSLENDLRLLLEGFPAFVNEAAAMRRLMDGNAVMQLLELPPGPLVGELLKALEEAQACKEVLNRSEAERFVQDLYAERYSK